MSGGRPRKFDEGEVLERAMLLFWERGFHATGLTELLEHMGIARQSLYDTFGNKRDLFIRAIRHYRDSQLAKALKILDRPGSAVANVRETVRFFEELANEKQCRGCFVANSIVEMGSADKEISELLGETLQALETGYRSALERAKSSGELSAEKSPIELAKALTNASIGLAVTGRLKQSRESVAAAYSGTLAMLD